MLMHHIRTNAKNTQILMNEDVKRLAFLPIMGVPMIILCPVKIKKQLAYQDTEQKTTKKSFNQKLTKHVLQLGALSLLALPVKALLANDTVPQQQISKVDQIVAKKEIVVATMDGDSTVFNDSDLQHGFGLDVAKRYAEYLGVQLRLQTYQDEESLTHALKNGDADMVLSVLPSEDSEFSTNLIGCDSATQNALVQRGIDANVGFTFLKTDSGLIDHSASFLCSQEQLAQNQTVAQFYDRTLLKNDYSKYHFNRAMSQKLPMYETAFKKGADKHNHDWQVLAAISYQESHLDPEAVSPTGVQGLMMLTNDTAKEMGVEDRTDALQSIAGGAKYLERIYGMFNDVPESERLWFVLASYNMGPNAIKRIQKELTEQGKDANLWSEVYTYLANNADKNSRYVQCMHYVTNIRSYVEAIKTMNA
jgi:membrane-bound lytic murein transglycosylase F